MVFDYPYNLGLYDTPFRLAPVRWMIWAGPVRSKPLFIYRSGVFLVRPVWYRSSGNDAGSGTSRTVDHGLLIQIKT